MWAKIEVVPSESRTVRLPLSWEARLDGEPAVTFGKLSVPSGIEFDGALEADGENSFKEPGTIVMTEALRKQLRIPTALIYRVAVSASGIAIGPVIGLLLGIHTHRYTPKHMAKYSDRLGVYPEIGGLVYAFSPQSVNWAEHTAYGLYFNIGTQSWKYGCFPLPDVIYRRDFHNGEKSVRRLYEATGGRLFNSYRFSKYELFDFIGKDAELREFLPPTEMTSDFGQVDRFIARYSKVILKPVDLSRGRGICIIEKEGDSYRVTDYRYKHAVESVLEGADSLEKFFAINRGFFDKYLIQKYLELAKVDSCNFDIRVVMQKEPDREWGCTGIECRVSHGDCLITNISRGGSALTLGEALRLSFGSGFEALPEQILAFCRKFCGRMDAMEEHFAEFGMDIAVDRDKKIWLIESNVFPSFKGFKKMDRPTYLAIRYAPLRYALSLTQFAGGA